jgi:hypothetical protein
MGNVDFIVYNKIPASERAEKSTINNRDVAQLICAPAPIWGGGKKLRPINEAAQSALLHDASEITARESTQTS